MQVSLRCRLQARANSRPEEHFWKGVVGCVCLLFVVGGDVCLAFAREGIYLWVLEATSCSHPVDSGIFSHCQQFHRVVRA